MRAFVAYLFAVLAVGTGVWFGFFDKNTVEGRESRRSSSKTPVILSRVLEAPFASSLQALGTALANESVRLTANRSDLVKAIHFEDGQRVEKDQLLVELETAEEESRLVEAKALLVERTAAYERAVELNQKGISPDSEVQAALAQMHAAKAGVTTLSVTIGDHAVRAPFSGVLGWRRISVGTLLQATTEITTLDDLTVVKVDFTIPETWLSAVRLDQPLKALSDAWPGKTFRGKVTAIDTRLDPRTRSVTIRAVVENVDLMLRPGMLMKVEVDRGEKASLQVGCRRFKLRSGPPEPHRHHDRRPGRARQRAAARPASRAFCPDPLPRRGPRHHHEPLLAA